MKYNSNLHTRESLHLEIKNILRTFLGLKLKKKIKNIRRLPSVLMFLYKKRVVENSLQLSDEISYSSVCEI